MRLAILACALLGVATLSGCCCWRQGCWGGGYCAPAAGYCAPAAAPIVPQTTYSPASYTTVGGVPCACN